MPPRLPTICERLPPSTRHRMRSFLYEPAEGRHFADCRDGTLIFEDSPRLDTPGNDRDYTSYAVEEIVSESPGTHRVFVLERTSGIVDEPGPYEVAIPVRVGFAPHCSCTAGQVGRVVCRHVLAMAVVAKRVTTQAVEVA